MFNSYKVNFLKYSKFLILSFLCIIFINHITDSLHEKGYSNIIPAFDIMLLYYFITQRNASIIAVLFYSFAIDLLFLLPIGFSGLSFVLGYLFCIYISKFFLLKEYTTNVIVFSVFSLLVIILRYCNSFFYNSYSIELVNLLFYYLVTIFIYPTVKLAFLKLLELLK